MTYAYAPQIEAAVLAVAFHPSAMGWAVGWLAAGLGFWLRAVMPPAEDDLDPAIVMAGCAM